MTNAMQPAATLVLLREAAAAPEIFLQTRAETMGFAGGMMVFPGGKLDANDFELVNSPLVSGGAGLDADDVASRIAAVRESFEEAGVLLTRGPEIAASDFAAAQPAIASRALGFGDFLARHNHCIDLDALVPFARWIPPENSIHRRYDTRFYLALMPGGAEAGHDGNEATTSCWITAAEALARADRDEARIIFPTRRNLERLAQFASIDALFDHARTTPLVTVQPTVRIVDGDMLICIPDGIGYPVTSESANSAMRG